MEIKKEQNGTSLTMFLSGRLDTVAAAEDEEALRAVRGLAAFLNG